MTPHLQPNYPGQIPLDMGSFIHRAGGATLDTAEQETAQRREQDGFIAPEAPSESTKRPPNLAESMANALFAMAVGFGAYMAFF